MQEARGDPPTTAVPSRDRLSARPAEPRAAGHGAPGPGLDVAIVRHGDVRLVLLEGPLDVYTVPILRRRTRARPAGDGRLVVDLTGVTLLDSSGLSALLQLRNHAAHDRPQLIGLICPPRLRRLFEIGGLLQAFAFGEDLPAVLAAMEAGNA